MIQSNQVRCPACKGTVAMRVSRSGFWQRSVLNFVGIYPWKCATCGALFLYRCRGHHRTGHSDSGKRVPGQRSERANRKQEQA